MKPYQAVILDRDGVINHDSDDYIKTVAEWLPIDGTIDAIARLKKAGFKVVVASNQSGVGRGYFDVNTLHAMHAQLHDLLAEQSVALDRLYFCPHNPEDGCACRKPKTAMLQMALTDLGLAARDVLFVGDSLSDHDCARDFGCDFALVLTGKGSRYRDRVSPTTAVFTDLAALAAALCAEAVA